MSVSTRKQLLETEMWATVVGFPGMEVSSFGNVRSFLRRGPSKVLRGVPIPRKTRVSPFGYAQAPVRINGKYKNLFVHTMVAEAFIRPIQTGEVVNHIDRNKLNNRLANLEIVSHKINMYHIREFDWVKAAVKAALSELGFKMDEQTQSKPSRPAEWDGWQPN